MGYPVITDHLHKKEPLGLSKAHVHRQNMSQERSLNVSMPNPHWPFRGRLVHGQCNHKYYWTN